MSISQELRDRGFNAYSMADSLKVSKMWRGNAGRFRGIAPLLLVAAIGITNTMVMSIYERTMNYIMKVVVFRRYSHHVSG